MKSPRIRAASECVVCGSPVRFASTTWHKNPDRFCYIHECSMCGFVHVLKNDWDYVEEGFTESSSVGPRVGQENHFGREFHMASMAVDILDRGELDVLILGSGRSVDWRHISELPQVASVTTSDLENFNGSKSFVALDERGERTFDIVVACEVVEHFVKPREYMADLCNDVNDTGLAVLSTNIYDGSDLSRHWYPFIPGHVAYYTPDAMIYLADENDMYVDFRMPKVSVEMAGTRKRYVLMSRNEAVIDHAGDYFAKHSFAPSEDRSAPDLGPVAR